MKYYILFIAFLFLSCNKNKKPELTKDKDLMAFSNLKESDLTKVEITPIIDLDTINEESKKVEFQVKNIGEKDLNPLIIKPTCTCIIVSKYNKVVKPNQEQRISVNVPIEEFGNFSKTIFVYGNFFPYMQRVNIIGYRRKQ